MNEYLQEGLMLNGRVICATDLQPRSDLAVHRAALLARQIGAKLTVVHAIDVQQPQRLLRAQANRAYVQLLSKIDRLYGAMSAFSGVDIDIAVRAGRPLDVIADIANHRDADLLVVAAPQARRFDQVIGTTAERLIRAVKRPILIVDREAHDSYRNVVLATDMLHPSVRMLRTIAHLQILERAHATVLHAIAPPYYGMMRASGVEEEDIQSYRHGWQEEVGSGIRTMLAAAGLSTERIRIVVETDLPPLPAIRSMLERERPELLVIGASRWFFLKRLLMGSIADGVLRNVMSDVLVIPQQFNPARIAPARRLHARRATLPEDHAPTAG